MKRVLLIRHGQTDWNLEGRWQGHTDVPLNQAGLEQARALAEHLRNRPITAVYSSDLTRALMTAERIAEARGLTVQIDHRLREMNLGVFQGLTIQEIKARYPDEWEAMMLDYMGYVLPKGESRATMQRRAYEALAEYVECQPDESEIALVTHGGTIRVLLLRLFSDDPMGQKSLHNTSITMLETDGGSWYMRELASTSHLVKAGDSHETL